MRSCSREVAALTERARDYVDHLTIGYGRVARGLRDHDSQAVAVVPRDHVGERETVPLARLVTARGHVAAVAATAR